MMRIWGNIKVNDIVTYKDEKYRVEEIYKEEIITYGVLRNIETEKRCIIPLSYCRLAEK